MKKIGVLFGMENTFPGALVDRINAMDIDGIRAEFVTVGGGMGNAAEALRRRGGGCLSQ